MLATMLAGGLSACQAVSDRTVAAHSSRVNAHFARLCGQTDWPETRVGRGAYVVQNDEWNSTAPECITTNGSPQFTVASSSISKPVSGDPGGYPSIFSGCSAGVCTAGNKMPIQVSDLKPGVVTSNWTTAQPPSGAYDVSYDIWFNHAPVTSGPPDGGELMIWLAHRGGGQVAPGGAPVARITIGGYAYAVWRWSSGRGSGQASERITYVMVRAIRSVHDLDLSAIVADAARRGYLAGSSYLLNVQAGFEIWRGGAGLETKSFAINVGR
jgi:cellulose 1,4-beta-cellobiosidase